LSFTEKTPKKTNLAKKLLDLLAVDLWAASGKSGIQNDGTHEVFAENLLLWAGCRRPRGGPLGNIFSLARCQRLGGCRKGAHESFAFHEH